MDIVHRLACVVGDRARLRGLLGHVFGQTLGLARVFGRVADRGVDFLKAGSGFLDGGRLLLGSLRQILIALGDFTAGHFHRQGAALNVSHQLGGAFGRLVESAIELR